MWEKVQSPLSGGIDLFVGTVRNHSNGVTIDRLEYTAYVPMAEREMAKIENEIRSRWPVQNVVLLHRIGRLWIGDIAVVTAVSSAHRREAFEACRFAIDAVKQSVPIWKKEFTATGAMWGSAETAGHGTDQ